MVSVMLSFAVDSGVLETNPLLRLKKLKEAGKREVRVTQEQMGELVTALPASIADIVEFAVYSGFRKENILSLRVEQVQFHDIGELVDVRLITKGDRHETTILGGPAVEVLRRVIGRRTTGYVFLNPQTGSRYSKQGLDSFGRRVREMRLTVEMDGQQTPLRFHDLRHITATWGHQAGISQERLQVLLGHTSKAMTERYTTFDKMAVARDLEKLPRIRKTG